MGTNLPTERPYRAVKEAVPLEERARRFTDLQSCGGKAWFTGNCPLPDHDDRHPSFYIYPGDTGYKAARWYCFGCGRGGDVIDLEFLCGDYGELYEAMLQLAHDFDVQLPHPSPARMEWMQEKHRRRDGLRDVLAESYRRRLFRLYRAHLEDLESVERDLEAPRIWRDLWKLSQACAERRLYGGPR